MTQVIQPDVHQRIPEAVRDCIVTVDFDPNRETRYDATVIVVTYDREPDVLDRTVQSLADQDATSYEVLLVDNGLDWNLLERQTEYNVVTGYVEFDDNYGVNRGRNLGAHLANGEVLVFLDDDAVPAQDFVREHLNAHRKFDIVGARGRLYPKTSGPFSEFGPRYDMGDEAFPYPLTKEGNMSITADAFEAVGGFDEELYGHEGRELTARLVERYGAESTIYYPDAIVYHDYVDGFVDLVTKKARHNRYQQILENEGSEAMTLNDKYAASPPTENLSIVTKIYLYSVIRITDVLAAVLAWFKSYDTPTR